MSESLPEIQSGESQMAVAIRQMKRSLIDQTEKHARFCRLAPEASGRMIEKVEGVSGSPGIRLEGGPDDGAVETSKLAPEGYGDLVSFESVLSSLRCKFMVLDKFSDGKLLGSVEIEAVDWEYVSKWCRFLTNVGRKLSDSGRCEDEFLRMLSNFNLGAIKRIEFRLVVVDMIREYPDLMHEFDSLFPLRDHDNEEVGSMSDRSSLDGAAEEKVSGENPTEEKEASDESMGLVEVEEGVDKEVVSKWCSFLTKVGGKLSSSGRCKYDLLRQFNNFNLGLINQVEFGVVVTDMIKEYPDLMHEFVSFLPHEDGSKSDRSSELAKENGTTRKRKRVAEAPRQGRSPAARKRARGAETQRRVRCREITEDEEDDMFYADVLEGQLTGALAYGSHIFLHGPSDADEWRGRKAFFERIVRETYKKEGLKVLAKVEEDPAHTLPVVLSRLQQKHQEHKNRKDQLRTRTSAQAYRK